MKHTTVDRFAKAVRRYVEPAHSATRYDAGNGQGTIIGWPEGDTLEHPVLDGSTQGRRAERAVENPWRGLSDPALIRHPSWKRAGKPRWFWG